MPEQCRATRVALLGLAVALALAGIATLLGLMGTLAEAYAAPYTLRYVSAATGDDGPPANYCTQRTNPCRTIQYAIYRANPGDIILVATGTYSDMVSFPAPAGYPGLPAGAPITQVALITKNLVISGGFSTSFLELPNPQKRPTVLSSFKTHKGRLIAIVGAISPTIYGLRLTKGDATGLGGGWGSRDAGGGVYILSATATLHDNRIYSNTAAEGGGLYLYYSDSTLSGNVVTTNTAEYAGGLSLRSSDATLSGNTILSNTAASNGGGLYMNYSNATLSGNTVASNTAGLIGGGLFLEWQSAATLSDNTILSNTALNGGGGLYLNYSNATLSGNTVASNTAGSIGGGLFLDWQSAATLSGNTILSNTALNGGGGLYANYSNVALNGNTIMYNSVRDEGGGLTFGNDSRAELSGDIVMANSASEGGGLYVEHSAPTLTNTVIADNRAVKDGGGLYVLDASPRLLHATIARNTGRSGVCVVDGGGGTYSTVALTNTILVSHTLGITVAADNAASLESTLWYSNTEDWGGAGTLDAGAHNYWDDPRFDLDGYHLLTDSAAISKGIEAGVTFDIDGQRRDANPDLGADEWGAGAGIVYLPLILED